MPTDADRGLPARPIRAAEDRVLDIDGKKVPYDYQIAWCAIATPTGLPATVVPIGHDAHGLPIGAQIVGGFLDDYTTIAFASMVERRSAASSRRPTIRRDLLAEAEIGEDHFQQTLDINLNR